ncbi:MAG: Hsp20/alpha crystallin family protein [Polyangia bacterium]|jgi:HSP20 family protein|nr:Hsp20/alpha crystallin family protein [Polyangia bacterium]
MLTLWRPFNELDRIHRQFDNLFRGAGSDFEGASYTPAVEINEDEDKVIVRADLPGVKQEDVEVKVEGNVLYLSGKRESVKEEKSEGRYYSERCSGSFFRSFRLGPKVSPEGIQAKLKDGVLTVELPKKEEARPKQIPVTAI